LDVGAEIWIRVYDLPQRTSRDSQSEILSQFSAEILILGFLQLIEEMFQLNSIPVTLSKLIVGSHKPNKT
jgi:hypothetical protein